MIELRLIDEIYPETFSGSESSTDVRSVGVYSSVLESDRNLLLVLQAVVRMILF